MSKQKNQRIRIAGNIQKWLNEEEFHDSKGFCSKPVSVENPADIPNHADEEGRGNSLHRRSGYPAGSFRQRNRTGDDWKTGRAGGKGGTVEADWAQSPSGGVYCQEIW